MCLWNIMSPARSMGQGHKVANKDVIWKCVTPTICIPNINSPPHTDQISGKVKFVDRHIEMDRPVDRLKNLKFATTATCDQLVQWHKIGDKNICSSNK